MSSAATHVPAPQTSALRRGRALHLVDLENLIRTGSPTTGRVAGAWAAYQAVVQAGDQVLVACSEHAAPAV